MANIPLISAAQHTYARFKRRNKQQAIYFDDSMEKPSRQHKRTRKNRLGDRRNRNIKVRFEYRSNQDRRNQDSSEAAEKNSKGRVINTTA